MSCVRCVFGYCGETVHCKSPSDVRKSGGLCRINGRIGIVGNRIGHQYRMESEQHRSYETPSKKSVLLCKIRVLVWIHACD